jgi:hypothetical protein
MTYTEALYLLKVLYSKILEILGAVCHNYVLVRNPELNFYYTTFNSVVDGILKLDGFEDLAPQAPELFESLIGNMSDADIEWDEGISKWGYDFLGKIEKEFIVNGSNTYKLPLILEEKLQKADEAIREHRGYATSAFDQILKNIDKNKEVLQNGFTKSSDNDQSADKKVETQDIMYEVKYSENNREITINNFLIAKPDFNSENEVVFSYLYRNANKIVKTEELEKQVGGKLKKPIHNILRDLGFTGKFAQVFFSASKSGVKFRNPITHQDLKDLGIERLKIQEKK